MLPDQIRLRSAFDPVKEQTCLRNYVSTGVFHFKLVTGLGMVCHVYFSANDTAIGDLTCTAAGAPANMRDIAGQRAAQAAGIVHQQRVERAPVAPAID